MVTKDELRSKIIAALRSIGYEDAELERQADAIMPVIPAPPLEPRPATMRYIPGLPHGHYERITD